MNPIVLRFIVKVLGSTLVGLAFNKTLNQMGQPMFESTKISTATKLKIKACVNFKEGKKELQEIHRILLEAGQENLVDSLLKKVNTILKELQFDPIKLPL